MRNKIIGEALTFDDVLLVPAYSEVLPKETNTKTRFTRNIELNVPLLAAAMDTVTESELAIAIAREGGIGMIHKNMPVQKQAEEVDRVKRSESGMIYNPITLRADSQIREALTLMRRFKISGIPIVDGQKLVGILTNRDLRFQVNAEMEVKEVMTRENLITAQVGTTLEQAEKILQEHRIEKLPVVDDRGNLEGLITVKDIQKKRKFPMATKDEHGRLRVGAAVGIGEDTSERVHALVEALVDVIVVDTAHGHSRGVLQTLRSLKEKFSDLELIAGNVATAEAAEQLIQAGADGVKVGMGPGTICTTRVVAGIGMPQITAIMNCAEACQKHSVPLISDGGIKQSGDIPKAIAAGADSVMIGSLFAGTEESPGEKVYMDGRIFKVYRGMGSISAMQRGSSDRYFQEPETQLNKFVPEGIEGRVPYRGNLGEVVYQLVGGLKAAMGYCGTRDIPSLKSDSKFVKVSPAGLMESHPHDVVITQEAPNYKVMK
ncbi:IMP dehydrogenase [candidate division KSB1 bacterium]|nr:IMP dehydrogenase [candidate division KSB1 bacterium]NIR70924.1 IMP dehydrogenase [candidate division KSB1 bacterium]NIS23096.1 IMP dehydrogenase [candidate division KSB1 bacterium]NIT69931.1 IMP dehydrogenase [candidate division KSB1 bacterium]NIU23597.1 IMP dehydrogenase [candidate division KSB1 bacterium]